MISHLADQDHKPYIKSGCVRRRSSLGSGSNIAGMDMELTRAVRWDLPLGMAGGN
jgi:hypothetical protein